MYKCRSELEKDTQGAIKAFIAKGHKGALVEKIDFEGLAFPFTRIADGATRLGCVTTSILKVTVQGKARQVTVPVMHGFCPFCGVKYE
jgi:hypothetical protein